MNEQGFGCYQLKIPINSSNGAEAWNLSSYPLDRFLWCSACVVVWWQQQHMPKLPQEMVRYLKKIGCSFTRLPQSKVIRFDYGGNRYRFADAASESYQVALGPRTLHTSLIFASSGALSLHLAAFLCASSSSIRKQSILGELQSCQFGKRKTDVEVGRCARSRKQPFYGVVVFSDSFLLPLYIYREKRLD